MTTSRTDTATPGEPDTCLHFHALFLDTQLDVVYSPALGRRLRAALARLVMGRKDGPAARTAPAVPDDPAARAPEARTPEEKGAAR